MGASASKLDSTYAAKVHDHDDRYLRSDTNLGGTYAVKPPDNDEYALKSYVNATYAQKPPTNDSYALTSAVNTYAPKPPTNDSYALKSQVDLLKPPVNDSYALKSQVDLLKPPVNDSYALTSQVGNTYALKSQVDSLKPPVNDSYALTSQVGNTYALKPPTNDQYALRSQVDSLKPPVNESYALKSQVDSLKPPSNESYALKSQVDSLKPPANESYALKSQVDSLKPPANESYALKSQVSESYSVKGHNHDDKYALKNVLDGVIINAPNVALVDAKLYWPANPALCLGQKEGRPWLVSCDNAPSVSHNTHLRRIAIGGKCLTNPTEASPNLSVTECTGQTQQQFSFTAGGEVFFVGPSDSLQDNNRFLAGTPDKELNRQATGLKFSSDATAMYKALIQSGVDENIASTIKTSCWTGWDAMSCTQMMSHTVNDDITPFDTTGCSSGNKRRNCKLGSGPPPRQYGRYVRVYQTEPCLMNLGQVKIFNNNGGNVANNSLNVVTASSVHPDYPLQNLVNAGPDEIPTKMFHTRGTIAEIPWVEIALVADALISRIVVHNRTDCPTCTGRITGARVEIYNMNRKLIYKSDPFPDKSGRISTNEVSDGFMRYEVRPPERTVYTYSDIGK